MDKIFDTTLSFCVNERTTGNGQCIFSRVFCWWLQNFHLWGKDYNSITY